MKALGISLDEPEVLVFIHRHMDHIGGLKAFSLRQGETRQDCGSHKPLCQSLRRRRLKEMEIGVDFTREYLESRG
jgi:7,8-dihydropterin-6-yl-methyl-4-(beta-D-ribofuranosyl)aminobenzene 5'-phosphate synthase